MPLSKAKKDLTGRKSRIDAAVNKATAPAKKKAKKKKVVKNPYPAGSYRAKAWARKQREGKK